MALEDRIGAVTIVDRSPWNDIPFLRCLLSLALNDRLPEPVGWSASPASATGLAAYESYIDLDVRWSDERPEVDKRIRTFVESPWNQIVASDHASESSIAAGDVRYCADHVVAAIGVAYAAYPVELSMAHRLLTLSDLITDHAHVQRRTYVIPRRHYGEIDSLTSRLEGFDRLRRVAVAEQGRVVWVEFLGGYRYRIPVGFLATWKQIDSGVSEVVITHASLTSHRRALRIVFSGLGPLDIGAETILLNCEPEYHAAEYPDWDRTYLAEGIRRYGTFFRTDWLLDET